MGIREIIMSIEDYEPLQAATKEQIAEAEKELDVRFSSEYKELLREFGAVIMGDRHIVGIAKPIGLSVVRATKEQREYNKKIPMDYYVIEEIPIDGIVIWQDNKGIVYKSVPNVTAKKIADSLTDYLLNF